MRKLYGLRALDGEQPPIRFCATYHGTETMPRYLLPALVKCLGDSATDWEVACMIVLSGIWPVHINNSRDYWYWLWSNARRERTRREYQHL